MTSDGVNWLRPATRIEELFEARHQKGTSLSVYVLKLGSVAPLEPPTVKQALLHLHRKVPNLRACFGSFEGRTWFRESTNDNIDFQVVTDEDVLGVMASIRTRRYNSFEGPLWCARFLPDASPKGLPGPDASPEGHSGPDASPDGVDQKTSSSSQSPQDTSSPPTPLTGIDSTSYPAFSTTLVLVSGSSSPALPTAGSRKFSPPGARYISSAPASPLSGLGSFSPISLASSGQSLPSGAGEASSCSSHVEELSSLPYKSHLALGLHNSVADGFTAMKICGFIVQLLNYVIAGTPIDEEQLGRFTTWESSWMGWGIKEVQGGYDALLAETLKDELEARKKCKPEMKALFRVPEGPGEKGCHFTRTLDLASTRNFLEKCRSQGVRLHSAFCALANLTFVDLLVKRNVHRNCYVVCSSHYNNLRRYWGRDASLGLGCNIAPFHLCMDTKKDESTDFWSFVRSFQGNLEKAMDHEKMRRESSALQICVPAELDNWRVFLEPWPFETDYYTSNMGDVTALVTEGGPHVCPEHLVSSTSINKLNFAFSHVFHTFRGRFIHTLDYNTQLVTDLVAEEYCNRLFDKLSEVING